MADCDSAVILVCRLEIDTQIVFQLCHLITYFEDKSCAERDYDPYSIVDNISV